MSVQYWRSFEHLTAYARAPTTSTCRPGASSTGRSGRAATSASSTRPTGSARGRRSRSFAQHAAVRDRQGGRHRAGRALARQRGGPADGHDPGRRAGRRALLSRASLSRTAPAGRSPGAPSSSSMRRFIGEAAGRREPGELAVGGDDPMTGHDDRRRVAGQRGPDLPRRLRPDRPIARAMSAVAPRGPGRDGRGSRRRPRGGTGPRARSSMGTSRRSSASPARTAVIPSIARRTKSGRSPAGRVRSAVAQRQEHARDARLAPAHGAPPELGVEGRGVVHHRARTRTPARVRFIRRRRVLGHGHLDHLGVQGARPGRPARGGR